MSLLKDHKEILDGLGLVELSHLPGEAAVTLRAMQDFDGPRPVMRIPLLDLANFERQGLTLSLFAKALNDLCELAANMAIAKAMSR